jgi:CheY-like chemotaxis protein
MAGELVSLRILLAANSAPDRELMRQAAALASVPVDILEAGTLAAARQLLATREIDIAFFWSAMPADERPAFVSAARSAKPQPFVILVVAGVGEAAGIPAEARGDGVVLQPADAQGAKALMERCIRVRLPKRILVVDDSQTMRGIVRKILGASRFRLEVTDAQEGIEALNQIATGAFDMVFLDYNMPGLNGVETLSEIKRQYPKLGVVLMTSTADEVIAERARKAGASAFLKKPFYPADIDAILHRVLGLRVSV